MKRKLLTGIALLMLSASVFFGCSSSVSSNNPTLPEKDNSSSDNATDTPGDTVVNPENDSATSEDDTSNDSDDSSILEKKVKDKFEEAINAIYNVDYSNESNKISVEDYIQANFTPEGKKSAINKIIGYNQKISYSDILVTLIKEVNNTDDRYSKMYTIRYNITVAFDKASIYQDLNSIIFIDKDGNIKIDSLHENNF